MTDDQTLRDIAVQTALLDFYAAHRVAFKSGPRPDPELYTAEDVVCGEWILPKRRFTFWADNDGGLKYNVTDMRETEKREPWQKSGPPGSFCLSRALWDLRPLEPSR